MRVTRIHCRRTEVAGAYKWLKRFDDLRDLRKRLAEVQEVEYVIYEFFVALLSLVGAMAIVFFSVGASTVRLDLNPESEGRDSGFHLTLISSINHDRITSKSLCCRLRLMIASFLSCFSLARLTRETD